MTTNSVPLPIISQKSFDAAYGLVVKILDAKEEGAQDIQNVLQVMTMGNAAPEQKMLEMARYLTDVGTPLAMRCRATLILGYDVGPAKKTEEH